MTKTDNRIVKCIDELKDFIKTNEFKYIDHSESHTPYDNFNGNGEKSIASCNYGLKTIFVNEAMPNIDILCSLLHECGHMIEFLTRLNNGTVKYPFSKNYKKRELRASVIGNHLRSLLNIDDIISEKQWNELQRLIRSHGYLMKF